MVNRRVVLTSIAGAVTVSGCLGSSDDDENDDRNSGTDTSDTDTDGTENGPAGEVVFEGARSEAIDVDLSARFEEGTVDEILVVEGSVTNAEDAAVTVELSLAVEQFRRDASTTVELGAGDSSEFEIRLESVYAPQFDGYTLTVTAE